MQTMSRLLHTRGGKGGSMRGFVEAYEAVSQELPEGVEPDFEQVIEYLKKIK